MNGKAREARSLTPGRALRHGIAMLPGGRKGLGGALSLTVGENVTLPTLGAVTGGGVLRSRAERTVVSQQLSRYGVRPARGDLGLGLLSAATSRRCCWQSGSWRGPRC